MTIRNFLINDPPTIQALKKRLGRAMASDGKVCVTATLIPDELSGRRAHPPEPKQFHFQLVEARFENTTSSDDLAIMAQDEDTGETVFIYTQPRMQFSVVS